MDNHSQAWSLRRWQITALIISQLLFAACASSVLLYNAHGWAPDIISFGWLSYRALNIYVSLALIAYIIFGLLHRHAYIVVLLAVFVLFHLVEGAVIGFWTKAILQLAALCILILSCYQSYRTSIR